MLEILVNSYFILGISIVAAIVVMVSLERENEGIATTAVCATLALLLWNYGQDVWSFIKSDIQFTILFVLGYLVAGVVWSFLKWNEFVKKAFKKFRDVKTKFIKENGEIENDKGRLRFGEKLSNNGFRGSFYNAKTMTEIIEIITPKGIDNKSSIIAWISYWPLSLLATLLNNPFRRLFEYTYSLVSGLYDEIGKKHAKGLQN